MSARSPRRFARFALGLLLASLAGCGGLLPEPPIRQIYRTTPAFAFTGGSLPQVPAQLLVAAPIAPAGLDTRRIALSRSPVSLDYFAGAEWSDRAPYLIQAALVEGFEKSGAIRSVAPEGLGLRADFVLETAVRDFEAVYDSPEKAPQVTVALNLKLIKMPERQIIAQGATGRSARATANTMADIVPAFDAALGAAAQEAVAWTLANPALSRRR